MSVFCYVEANCGVEFGETDADYAVSTSGLGAQGDRKGEKQAHSFLCKCSAAGQG